MSSLAAARQPLTDLEFLIYVLAGLGSKYESIVMANSTQATLPSLHQVLSHLLLHESRLAH